MTLIARPFITIHGNETWCEQIICNVIPNLPMEPTEWVRKKGSDYKIVHVNIDARKFNQNDFSKYEDSILGGPLFHLFVIIENEELYINSTKNLFGNWISLLRSRSIDNWRLIIVPDISTKSKNKFAINKFILTNKMKIDFNLQKLENHSIKLSDNPKERFSQIQKFIRNNVLSIYDDTCFKIEDKIRIQRETRYTVLWNYFDFFSLQEELADIYECLNLCDESLAQLDESDAVFFNCIESYYKGEKSKWISSFKDIPFEKIDCLMLVNYSDPEKRVELANGKLCLTDFRAYLLSRQCALLQLLNRYQEIPALVYSTLLKFLNECKLLDINIDSNLKNCWIFMTSLQALQRFTLKDCDDSLAQDYAALFRLALNSINKLALSLDIWSSSEIDWNPVCILRQKLSILSNDEYGDTPSSRLAGGFRSQIYFQEFHSKLFEEALMTWKHIGRMRSANLLGIQLADLYYKVHQYKKAEPLYIKAIKCLRDENWAHLAMPLRLKLAVCHKDIFENDPEKHSFHLVPYLKTCIHLAGATFSADKFSFNPDLLLKNESDHKFYFIEWQKCINLLYDKFMKPQEFLLQPLFSIENIKLISPDQDGFQMIKISLNSYLPEAINVKLLIEAVKFPLVDLTLPLKINKSENLHINNANDLLDFPAQYSIPLSSKSSPKVYRVDKPDIGVVKSRRSITCQSSVEDETVNLNCGVSVEIMEIEDTENRDKLVSLICYPKMDKELISRKLSLSKDTGFSLCTLSDNRTCSDNILKNFVNFYSQDNTILNPGNNQITLKSTEYGFFLPYNIEISLFKGEAIVKDCIKIDMLDNSWNDSDLLNKLLPDILIEDYIDNFGFINFKSELNPKIKLGLLSFPQDDIELELYINKKQCSNQRVSSEYIKESNVLKAGSIVSLAGSLEFVLEASSDEINLVIPNLMKKQHLLAYFEQIYISASIFRTSSSKYIVSVCLSKPATNQILECSYQIKNSTLKLHHQNDIRQLLPLAHPSLSTGTFNSQTEFTILWMLESIDIVNFEKESLKFTLSIDLILDISDYKQLSGGIIQNFELRNI